jgi:anti-sigma regulatory factor (Ser/Thr protein kinase)
MEQAGLRHEALIYDDVDAFLAGALPFLTGALDAEEPVLVAVSRINTGLLEAALGRDAARIRFADIEALGRNPARIIPLWRDFVDGHGGRPVRGVGEPVWPGREFAEIDECQRHEALLNVAFAPPPAWSLLCSYDAGSLEDEVLAGVAESHPLVSRDGVGRRSEDYVAGVGAGFAGALPSPPAAVSAFEFERASLAEVRRRVERAAEDAGLPAQRTVDLAVAASELAANSVAHGGGGGVLRCWREADRLLIEVEDRGLIDEPLVGRERPRLTQEGGRGVWLANQLCDLVQIRSGPDGTRVRLQAAIG